MTAPWFWPMMGMVASGASSAATGVKGPTAQPGQAPAGNWRQQMQRIQATGDLMSQISDMRKEAMVGGHATGMRAPQVSSGSGGPGLQGAPMNPSNPMGPRGAMSSNPMAYSSPRGSEMPGGMPGGGPQPIRQPMQAPTPAPTPEAAQPLMAAQMPGPTPAMQTPTTPQGPPTSTTSGGGVPYAQIAAALASAASNVKGNSVQAPGYIPGTVQGLTPSASQARTVRGGGGNMDINQLIRLLSSQSRGRRRY